MFYLMVEKLDFEHEITYDDGDAFVDWQEIDVVSMSLTWMN